MTALRTPQAHSTMTTSHPSPGSAIEHLLRSRVAVSTLLTTALMVTPDAIRAQSVPPESDLRIYDII
ncbi:MAG: hypothetical protein OEO23_15615, partial [Gemmatimonadota bacterium]|nr:hypothetical protein [Gemmatimonadota bacterium]